MTIFYLSEDNINAVIDNGLAKSLTSNVSVKGVRDKRARDKGVFEGHKYAYKVKDRAVNSYSIDENAGLVDKILKEGGRSSEGVFNGKCKLEVQSYQMKDGKS